MERISERIAEPLLDDDINLEQVPSDYFNADEKLPINEPEVDFSRLDLRVGKILDARCHPCAPDLLYLHMVDVGEAWGRPVGSRLVDHYELRELEDRMVILLCNVEMSWSRGLECNGVLICANNKKSAKIELLEPPPGAKIGDLVSVPGYGRGVGNKLVAPGDPRGPYHKLVDQSLVREFDTVAKDLKINKDGQATYRGMTLQVEGREGVITTNSLSDCPIVAVDCDEELY